MDYKNILIIKKKIGTKLTMPRVTHRDLTRGILFLFF